MLVQTYFLFQPNQWVGHTSNIQSCWDTLLLLGIIQPIAFSRNQQRGNACRPRTSLQHSQAHWRSHCRSEDCSLADASALGHCLVRLPCVNWTGRHGRWSKSQGHKRVWPTDVHNIINTSSYLQERIKIGSPKMPESILKVTQKIMCLNIDPYL